MGVATRRTARIIPAMHRTSRLLTSIVLAVPLALTASGAAAQSPSPVQVLDVEWSVTSLDGERIPADAGVTATFTASDAPTGALTGNGGCNTYSASWTSDGVALTVTDLAATRMACETAVSEREELYFDLLQDASGWRLDGAVLIIDTKGGSSIAFGEDDQPAPTEGITGTWTLDSIDGESVPDGVTATATFGEDGSLTGSGGCNNFSGSYTIEGGLITVGPIAATLKLCPDSSDTERLYLDALQGASTWSTTGGGLVLDGAGRLVFAGEGAPVDETATLTGQEWWVIAVDSEPFDPTLGASASFTEDGRISGSGGCNRFMGEYTAVDESLEIGPLASTRMACGPHIMDSETKYLAALQAATTFTIVEHTMFLDTADGGSVEFSTERDPAPAVTASPAATPAPTPEPVPTPAAIANDGLVGSWRMTEFAGSSIPGYEFRIDLTFYDTGELAGFAGCNDYLGRWSLDGSRLTISNVESASSGTCDAITQGYEDGYLAVFPYLDTVTFRPDGSVEITSTLAGGVGMTYVPAD